MLRELLVNSYTFMPHQQNVGQNHKTNIASKSFENVPEFKHLGITLTNKTVFMKKL
jgi:hypothetical protein